MSPSVSHPKPIVLVPIRARQAADETSRSRIPNSIPLGLYESGHGAGASIRACPEPSIPPLAYFCIRTLLNYADQVHGFGSHRIRCQPRVLRALSPPTFDDLDAPIRCLCKLDPRLWSIIAQVYSDLPKGLQNYYIPLSDRYLPLLQAIPSTPSFVLITVLNLAGSVSDETSHALKSLHGLCALDISQTSISHLGIRHFAPTITTKPSDPRLGTRGLRILRLCNCPKITNQVIDAVSNFPLLAILDLRGTGCTRDLGPNVFRPSRKNQRKLFQCSLQDALQRLRDTDSRNVLFSHPDPFVIHINTEFHPPWPQRPNHPKPAPGTSSFFPEKSREVTSFSAVSIYQRYHHQQDPTVMAAERELRKWISSILGDAGNETRISEITDFVIQRWEYTPERLKSDEGYDFIFPPEEDDSIDSWDEDSSTASCPHFCGYQVDEYLEREVWRMVEDASEEHESASLHDTTVSQAETVPIDRHLMLVRDPPPWDSVYGPDASPPRRVKLSVKPSLSSSLKPDRSSMRAKIFTQEMSSMITKRESLPAAATSPSLVSAPMVSNNPFRKKSSSGSARGGLKDIHRAHGNSAQGRDSDSVQDGPIPKRMKSISQIPVPLRPAPPLRSQRENSGWGPGTAQKKPGKLKQTTLLGVFGKRT